MNNPKLLRRMPSAPNGQSSPLSSERNQSNRRSRDGDSLNSIDLSYQGYDESKVFNVYQLIQQRQKGLVMLDLSFNSFGLSGTRLLTTGLKNFISLKELYLQGLFFGPDGTKCVSTLVDGNGVLEILNISECQVCDKEDYSGLQALCSALKSIGCGMKELDISNNNIGHKGLEKIRTAIQSNYIIEEIHYANNGFEEKDIESLNIQNILKRNRTHTMLIFTIVSAKNVKVGFREKVKAKMFFPGNPAVETPAISVKKDIGARWNYTTHFAVLDSTIRTPMRVELWGATTSKRRIGACEIPAKDLSSMHERRSQYSSNEAGNSDEGDGKTSVKQHTNEIKSYRIMEGHLKKGQLIVSIHAGNMLKGGILSAMAEFVIEGAAKRFSRHMHEQDVTDQIRDSVKNGFLMFEEGSDLKEEIVYSDNREISMAQAMMESARTYTKLKVDYRVGCHIIHKEMQVPIKDFTKIFVGYGVPLQPEEETIPISPNEKKITAQELVKAMAIDSRRRSIQFQGADMLMMKAAGKALQQQESRNLFVNNTKQQLSAAIKGGGATKSGTGDTTAAAAAGENTTAHSSKKKSLAKGFGKADKMKQLIMVSELFHIVTGEEGKRGSGLKGESLHDLVNMAGNQLPEPIKLKIRNYAQTQKIVHAKDFARWLRSERIDNNALQSILEHCRAVGSPKTLRNKLKELPATTTTLHLGENNNGVSMCKDTPSSRPTTNNTTITIEEVEEEEEEEDEAEQKGEDSTDNVDNNDNTVLHGAADAAPPVVIPEGMKKNRDPQQQHQQQRRASHARSATNAIIAAGEITGAAALASAEAAAAMNAMEILDGDAVSDKKLIQIRKAMNDAAKKMVEAMAAAQQMQIERDAAKRQKTVHGKDNNRDENNDDDDDDDDAVLLSLDSESTEDGEGDENPLDDDDDDDGEEDDDDEDFVNLIVPFFSLSEDIGSALTIRRSKIFVLSSSSPPLSLDDTNVEGRLVDGIVVTFVVLEEEEGLEWEGASLSSSSSSSPSSSFPSRLFD